MSIHEIVWSEDRIEHIARHNVSPEEVEEVYFSRSLLLRAKSQGENPVYYVLGQTRSGRYLFCVIIQFPGGKRYPVTARPMTDKEKSRYRQWKTQ
ncbi:BrnT family toxin [Candidatus Thiosymbion oneisti]|uniref:BrnT family toxin n=1 Tax=Candidatus Thiosymbion oneisti TaxID=589554 RepID=UPI000B7C7D7A|nr:BrnT family toxin [Candidatus Thiosymbion oneisti]